MRKQKRKFIFTLISFILISSFLVLTTFERNKTGFSVFGKTFFAGTGSETFDVDLFWTDNLNTGWKNVETTGNEIAFGSDILWEPDHTELRYFKVQNAGDYDFNYNLGIDLPSTELDTLEYVADHPIGDVIDVYICNDINNLTSKSYIGTLNDCFQSPDVISNLSLESGDSATFALSFVMKHTAGNEFQGTYDQNNNRINNIGFKIYAGAYADEPNPEYDGEFGIALPNNEEYLYRVGNQNKIYASTLFYVNDSPSASVNNPLFITASATDFDSSLLTFTYERIAGSNDVGFTFEAGSGATGEAFLLSSKFKFNSSGVLKITMKYNGQPKAVLNTEVVDGKNIVTTNPVLSSDSTFATNNNNILLEDKYSLSKLSISSGKTLYGNGFKLVWTQSETEDNDELTKRNLGFLQLSNGSSIDNVQVKGAAYQTVQMFYRSNGVDNLWYSPCVSVGSGGAKIYNSFIEECRVAVKCDGDLYAENSIFAGGTNGNMEISAGTTTLKNCITSLTLRSNGKKGLGIIVSSTNSRIVIEGTLTQYNWVKSSDLPSTYSTMLSDVFSNGTYAYTYLNSKYINCCVMCISPDVDFPEAVARNLIVDNTPNINNYGYLTKTASAFGRTVTATGYAQKAAFASDSDIIGFSRVYDNLPTLSQYPTIPNISFNLSNNSSNINYDPKDDETDPTYCYYDNGQVNISFPASEGAFEWQPMILTISKYGSSLDYTVAMNNTDYTNGIISLTQAGEYNVIYTVVDTYYYGQNAIPAQKTYTFNVKLVAIDSSVVVYHPEFSYGTNGSSYGTSSRQVTVNNKTYVMPDISSTNDNYGSLTLNGETIYYPVVNATYVDTSKGEIDCYVAAFKNIQIKDLNKDSGVQLYIYNSSVNKWPHNQSATAGPQAEYYSYDTQTGHPYEPGSAQGPRSVNYDSSQGGLVYKTSGISRDITTGAKNICFCYKGNDNIQYYYYLRVVYTAHSKPSSCLTEGTQITLADGTQKPIEKVTYEDKLLTYNFFTGKTEAKDIAILVNHGKRNYEVLNLVFKDGTLLRFIGDHGVFDYTLNKYVYPTADNYKDYIGHKFVRFKENGKYKKIKLVDAFVTNEYTTAYSITSAQNSNAIAENMLTVAPPDKFYNWIDMGRKMRYDKKQFDADFEKYGTYDYSVFEDYVSYEIYQAFNGPYLKVAVEKGKFTFDDIINLIELYGSYMQ